jgi:low affinity Fe/Cu permease
MGIPVPMARPPGTDPVVAHRRQWVDRKMREQPSIRWRRGQIEPSEGDEGRKFLPTPDPHRRHRTRGSRVLHQFGDVSSHAGAGLAAAAFVVAWAVVGVISGFPHWWEVVLYAISSSVTLVMVFAIQHTQSRQQQATQRKLDELLRTQPAADDHLIAAEDAPDEELQALADLNMADREEAKNRTY